MSRVARMPVAVPKGVDINLGTDVVSIKGPLGTLNQAINPLVRIVREGEELKFSAADESRAAAAMSGTYRALVANMVNGVTKGFERKLTLVGTGYRAAAQGGNLNLSLGFSHPVVYKAPAGITFASAKPTEIKISGADKQTVGQVAAEIRSFRPPEPYKGKGVRKVGEYVRRKEGKKK